MSNYGRYFEFRNSPRPENRYGRALSPNAVIPIGAPVTQTNTVNADGRNTYALAAAGPTAPRPVPVRNGIAIFEHSYNAMAGYDPVLVAPSDFSDIPANSPIQVVHGTNVKVVLRNIAADTEFLGRTYDDARVFVAPGDLTGLAVGDFLVPGAGDATGYWAEGGTAATAWLQISSIDTVRGEVEAQMLF